MSEFIFESDGTPIPILGAEWRDDPFMAKVSFQNDRFMETYGSSEGRLLKDIFGEVLAANAKFVGVDGDALMAHLINYRHIDGISGILNDRRIELYAKMQSDRNCIQVIAFDVTNRLTDPLTLLPGRELFFDRLETRLASASREGQVAAVLFVDVDGFKRVNDTYGHRAGDDVLREIAKRLKDCVRKHETVARLGGDEFVVILSGDKIDARFVAETKLIPSLNLPYSADGNFVDFVGASVGISMFPRDGTQADKLVAMADEAMYKAKTSGKNQAVDYLDL